MRLRGFHVDSVVRLHGEHNDLSKEESIRFWEAKLADGYYDAFHQGIECTTFSRSAMVKGCGPAYRDNVHILGLPLSRIGTKRKAKADLGNTLARASLRFWLAAKRSRKRVRGSWENPGSSLLWRFPGVKQATQADTWNYMCYCRYGRPFKKRTCIITAGFSLGPLSTLMCNHKQRHSVVLQGNHAGQCRTKLGNKYPKRLIRSWIDDTVDGL